MRNALIPGIVVLIFISGLLFYQSCLAKQLTLSSVSSDKISDGLAERGKLLRADLESKYTAFKQDKLKVNCLMRGIPIDDIVEKYIPVGTSFPDAEAILRIAGFQYQVVTALDGKHTLDASWDLAANPFIELQHFKAIIVLSPRIDNGFGGKVGKINAFIDYTIFGCS